MYTCVAQAVLGEPYCSSVQGVGGVSWDVWLAWQTLSHLAPLLAPSIFPFRLFAFLHLYFCILYLSISSICVFIFPDFPTVRAKNEIDIVMYYEEYIRAHFYLAMYLFSVSPSTHIWSWKRGISWEENKSLWCSSYSCSASSSTATSPATFHATTTAPFSSWTHFYCHYQHHL